MSLSSSFVGPAGNSVPSEVEVVHEGYPLPVGDVTEEVHALADNVLPPERFEPPTNEVLNTHERDSLGVKPWWRRPSAWWYGRFVLSLAFCG
jgi:hypothetical protein